MTLGGFRPAVMHRAAVLALIVAVAGCGGNKARSPIPLGEARLPVPGGRIWYTVSGSERGTPVVLLHGGRASRATTSSRWRRWEMSASSSGTTS